MNLLTLCISAALLINLASAEDSTPGLDSPDVTDAPKVDSNSSGIDATEKKIINLEHVESNSGYIFIKWNYTGVKDVEHFRVTSLRIDNGVLIKSPTVNEEEYTIEDLRTNTEYNICVTATFEDDTEAEECDNISTIPLLSRDSIIALIALVVFIFLLVLVSYCLAAKKRRDYEAEQMEEAEEEAEKDETLKNGETNGPISGEPPKSSIEEANEIPYITPPVSELSLDDRDIYHRSLHL